MLSQCWHSPPGCSFYSFLHAKLAVWHFRTCCVGVVIDWPLSVLCVAGYHHRPSHGWSLSSFQLAFSAWWKFVLRYKAFTWYSDAQTDHIQACCFQRSVARHGQSLEVSDVIALVTHAVRGTAFNNGVAADAAAEMDTASRRACSCLKKLARAVVVGVLWIASQIFALPDTLSDCALATSICAFISLICAGAASASSKAWRISVSVRAVCKSASMMVCRLELDLLLARLPTVAWWTWMLCYRDFSFWHWACNSRAAYMGVAAVGFCHKLLAGYE